MWTKGFIASTDGNISGKVSDTELIATPTAVSKGFLSPEELVRVDLRGQTLEGARKPSSEILMHLRVYRERPDVAGIVHGHPPVSTGFAVAGLSLERCVLPEVIIALGGVPLAEYGTPGTEEIPDSIAPYLKSYDTFLLANHGVLTVGKDVMEAYYKMEAVELFANITLTARLLGGEKPIPPPKVAELEELRERFGIVRDAHCVVDCPVCGVPGAAETCTSEGRPIDLSEAELTRVVCEVTERVLRDMNSCS